MWVWVGKWREDWEEAEDMEAVEGLGPGGGGGALRWPIGLTERKDQNNSNKGLFSSQCKQTPTHITNHINWSFIVYHEKLPRTVTLIMEDKAVMKYNKHFKADE